jgi:hypothetical protein
VKDINMAEPSHVKVIPYEGMAASEIALAMAEAEGWKPTPGDEIDGTLLGVKMGHSDYKANAGKNPVYPILFIRKDDGVTTSVHCFHAVLENEVRSARPLPGERIYIKYLGSTGEVKNGKNPPERYAVHVTRDNNADPWGHLG